MADQTGLLNTGAGMSVLGLTARERYQYGAQQAAYAGAQTALDCVLSQINSTNDAEVEWAGTQTGSKTTAQAAHALPDVIYKATKKVQQSLITRLGSISSEPIKGSEFDDVFRSQRSAYTKKNEASEQLQTQSQKDRVTIALKSDTQKMQALAKKDDGQKSRIDAEMMRITAERQLVPLHLQEMVGLNIVGMESKIAECTAGY
ncbi:hypothetical protein P7A97_08435 [Pseudomonas sp. GOM6]|nr:hypothetical protein [Pseudomonas sp. GOM6]